MAYSIIMAGTEEVVCQKRTAHMGIIVKYAASIRQMKSFLGKVMQPISVKPAPV